MIASDLFRQLLVSRDGYIDDIDIEHAETDALGNVHAPGLIVTKKQDLHQIGEAIEGSTLSHIKEHLEWTSRSAQSRLGFDVASIQNDTIMMRNGDMTLMAQFVFKPWENVDGLPETNPLPPLLKKWLQRTRIACGRLFMRPLDAAALTGDQIMEAKEQGKIDMNGAFVLSDGVVLPVHPNERYPLRHDLMDSARLRDAITGSGRGAIDSIQPRIHEECMLEYGAYGVVSTRCSLLEHRGVLEPRMIHLVAGEESADVRHGTSRIWDPGKTTGMQYARHLEVQNHAQGALRLSNYGVKMSVYPTNADSGIVSRVVSSSLTGIRRDGLNIDHYLQSDRQHTHKFRQVLDTMNQEESIGGILVGPAGIGEIRRESHAVLQDMASVRAAETYGHADASLPDDVQRDLCEYMGSMGDPRQRAIFFAREIPSPAAIRQLMERGVRTIVTDNVAQNDSKMYVSSSQLQHLRKLADDGLNLYLQTPKITRKLWNNFFVDIRSLEKVRTADVRFCIYCASATGGDRLLELAQYREFLEQVQRDFPHAAIVTGAARNGAMHWANLVARAMGIVTIGVANHIAGQETTEDELDAGTFFDKDGFNARQELMARTGACPIVGPGAQGSEFEGSLERTQAKIGKNQLPPIAYIDPIGLGESGRHLWQPVMDLERGYTKITNVPGGVPVQLTRSPYVANLTTLHGSYLSAYETRIRPYMQDPIGFWKRSEVPDEMVRTAMERIVRDSAYTGLPIPIYLLPVLKRLGIEG